MKVFVWEDGRRREWESAEHPVAVVLTAEEYPPLAGARVTIFARCPEGDEAKLETEIEALR